MTDEEALFSAGVYGIETFPISMSKEPEKALLSVKTCLLCPNGGDEARHTDEGDGSFDVVGERLLNSVAI
jgi:hypothetical protein